MICGDDTGLCKLVSARDGAVACRWGTQARGRGVARLCWLGDAVCCGRVDGTVDVWRLDPASRDVHVVARSAIPGTGTDEGVVGLSAAGDDGRRLVVGSAKGVVGVVTLERLNGGDGREAPFARLADLGKRCSQVAASPAGSMVAAAGFEHDLGVWSLDAMAQVFRARNVRGRDPATRDRPWALDSRLPAQTLACRRCPRT